MKINKLIILLCTFLFCFNLVQIKAYANKDIFKIYTIEDLQAIKTNPTGSFELMNDLNLENMEWEPFDFKGSLNGNGHSLLNVNISNNNIETIVAVDGNNQSFETQVLGFFNSIQNATIQNLNIINETINVQSSNSIFIGGISGYIENSTISNCTINSRINLEINNCSIAGIGGISGYGFGNIQSTNVNSEIVYIDTNLEQYEQQYLGGIIGNGIANIENCYVNLNGHSNVHGYINDGGLIGLWNDNVQPSTNSNITNNIINGSITYYRDNPEWNAYCSQSIGNSTSLSFNEVNNNGDFLIDEKNDNTINWLPEMDDNPAYVEVTIEPTHDDFGYTEHICSICGHSYKDTYNLKKHDLTNWIVVEKPTAKKDGLKSSTCNECGTIVYEKIPAMNITYVSFQDDYLQIKVDEQKQLNLISDSDELIYGSWQSSDENIVEVDENGNITGIKNGKATITFKILDSDIEESIEIYVGNRYGKVVAVFALSIFDLVCILSFIKRLKIKNNK